ncbi:hypothetical protein EDB80DRAFT_729427 [Ilyonectria destructans]|nr:hypothetical protein EDB80DRAFT_729427 [Ilyonectria destructans]
MGGTLGAILGILLTAFNNALKRQFTSQGAVTTAIFSDALGTVVESLKVYILQHERETVRSWMF